MKPRKLFQIALRSDPGIDGLRALGALLPTALRRHGLRCLRVTTLAQVRALEARARLQINAIHMSAIVISRRPDAIVGFSDTRIHAETASFKVRASEVASPRPGDQITLENDTYIVQGEPERRDPDRLVWTLDVRPA
jgi:hypothetical protein